MKIVECPRDAMQGIKEFIPTEIKVEYINSLLNVGFDTIDFGSFVSPKAIPQMKDTRKVLEGLDLSDTSSKLLCIVANERGARDASLHPEISYMGYPFSISETFQLRNTNATIDESLERLKSILSICYTHAKTPVIYISMGFGNPYGDEWNSDICLRWVDKLYRLGVRTMALSDTIGVAQPDSISYLFDALIDAYPDVEFGAHLHTTRDTAVEKIEAAYTSGCRRFDGAIKGYGGCPMAKDELTGNMPTEVMLPYLKSQGTLQELDDEKFAMALQLSNKVFL